MSIAGKMIISEKMLKDYALNCIDFLLKNDGFLRLAVGEQFPSLIIPNSLKINNNGESV